MKNDLSDSDFPNRRDFLKGSSIAAMMALMGGVEITGQETNKILAVPKADPNFKEKPAGPPVNLGVIGLGTWGKELIATASGLPNGPVVAVCDTYATSLRRASEVAPNASKHGDYREILDNKEVQGVIVATPTHQHHDIVIAALQAGKHVYCEAPMAASIEDARKIAQAAKDHPKLIFQVGQQARANPQHHHVLNFARAGAMGKNVLARGQWHKKQSWRRASPNAEREEALNWRLNKEISTGLIGEIGVHQLDVVNWFFGKMPVSVTGFGSLLWWTDGRQIPDTIQAVLEYPEGLRSVYDCTIGNSFDSTYDVFYGTDAAMMIRENKAWMFKEVDSPLLGWEVYARKEEFFSETGIMLVANATKLLAQGKKPAEGAADTDAPHKYSLQQFVDNINELKAPSCGYAEGYSAAVVAIKSNEAIIKNQKIIFQPEWFTI